jgi:glucose-6-phosphate isomerase
MAITLQTDYILNFVSSEEILSLRNEIRHCHEALHEKKGKGNEFSGWLTLPSDYDREEWERIKKVATKIQNKAQVLIVVGIGGSYLGARAALEFLHSPFYNNKKKDTPDIYFVGNNLSAFYLQEVIDLVGERDFCINVISKSGTTTEPAIAFRIFKALLESRYGKEEAKERIYATTDKSRGALKTMCEQEGYETFVIPDDIGGRYSVLTAVGMLPVAVSGIDIDEIMDGARQAMEDFTNSDLAQNTCYWYSAIRHLLYQKGKGIEILANFEPALTCFGEWYKQLFAESEGKENKGIFPTTANYTTDLHSIGQYIQQGVRNLFETILWIENPQKDILLTQQKDDGDGLNYLAGKPIHYVNEQAFLGTTLAHVDGGVPTLIISMKEHGAYSFGYLVYFFEKACALCGYLLDINPFDQPGVEDYKTNMFALLGKEGYQEKTKRILERLKK